MGTAIRIMEGPMINAQIYYSIETIQNKSLNGFLINPNGSWRNTGFFFALHQLKGEVSHRKIHIAIQEKINLTILLSADLTIDRRVVPHLTNKNFQKTKTRIHSMWSASLQPKIALMNHQTFGR